MMGLALLPLVAEISTSAESGSAPVFAGKLKTILLSPGLPEVVLAESQRGRLPRLQFTLELTTIESFPAPDDSIKDVLSAFKNGLASGFLGWQAKKSKTVKQNPTVAY